MALNYQYINGSLNIRFDGDIDEHAARRLRDELDRLIEAKPITKAVFDFTDVTFVDSTGLGLIFGRYKKLLSRGAELLIKNVPSQVDRVFRASGVYTVCPKIN